MNLLSIGKYPDQPLLTAKINKNIHAVLTFGSIGYLAYTDGNSVSKPEKRLHFLRNKC